jgi:hypothetical protein
MIQSVIYFSGYILDKLNKLQCSPWWKIYLKKIPFQDFLSSLNAVISTNESTEFITGHVIYNPAYAYKLQLKTTHVTFVHCSR